MDGLMETQVTGLVDTNMCGGIHDRKGEVLKGRFVSWAQKVESKRNFVDIWKGWMDGWMERFNLHHSFSGSV